VSDKILIPLKNGIKKRKIIINPTIDVVKMHGEMEKWRFGKLE